MKKFFLVIFLFFLGQTNLLAMEEQFCEEWYDDVPTKLIAMWFNEEQVDLPPPPQEASVIQLAAFIWHLEHHHKIWKKKKKKEKKKNFISFKKKRKRSYTMLGTDNGDSSRIDVQWMDFILEQIFSQLDGEKRKSFLTELKTDFSAFETANDTRIERHPYRFLLSFINFIIRKKEKKLEFIPKNILANWQDKNNDRLENINNDPELEAVFYKFGNVACSMLMAFGHQI